MKYIATFNTTHLLIKAERICLQKKLKIQIIPVPRYISSECGMCIRVDEEFKDQLEMILSDSEIEFRMHIFKEG